MQGRRRVGEDQDRGFEEPDDADDPRREEFRPRRLRAASSRRKRKRQASPRRQRHLNDVNHSKFGAFWSETWQIVTSVNFCDKISTLFELWLTENSSHVTILSSFALRLWRHRLFSDFAAVTPRDLSKQLLRDLLMTS